MPDYSFFSLNDKEFEELVRDLLQAEYDVFIQSFGRGRDGGIDLRYSGDYANEIVIQAKHYAASGYSKLLHNLKKSEKPKVDLLSPKRYVLATSVSLSPANKDAIKEAFSPYILSTQDILGLDDLNNLLRKHPNVASDNYKLWITSSIVLERLLNNAIVGRSAFHQKKISREISLFVQTPDYDRAKGILAKQSFVIITGAPGVGKSTLANMLVYGLMAQGFRLIKISDRIQEAEENISVSADEKQVFLFDDFLGATHREILFPRNRDSSIVEFIERIRATPNKILILTSRTNIYNQAEFSSERYQWLPFRRYECEINLDSYNTQAKAQILYNHLHFSDIPNEYKQEICKEKSYWEIIRHRNYNPRNIEQITSRLVWENVSPDQYLDLVLFKLDSPVDIWKAAYENQLTHEARCLLVSLYSLEINWGGVHELVLRQIFDERLRYEREKRGIATSHNAFEAAIALLQGGIVSTTTNVNEVDEYREFRVHAPSIIDFLNTYISKSMEEKAGLLNSICFLEQFERFWSLDKSDSGYAKKDLGLIPITEHEKQIHKQVILAKQHEYRFLDNEREQRSHPLFMAFVLSHLTQLDETIEEIGAWYDKIDFGALPENQLEMLLEFLITLPKSKLEGVVLKDWDIILASCFSNSTDWDFLRRFLGYMFKAYGRSYKEFMKKVENQQFIQEQIDAFWKRNIDKKINYHHRFIPHAYYEHDFDRIIDELKQELSDLCRVFLVEPSTAFKIVDEIDKEQTMWDAMDEANYWDAVGADTMAMDRMDMLIENLQDGIRGIDDMFR